MHRFHGQVRRVEEADHVLRGLALVALAALLVVVVAQRDEHRAGHTAGEGDMLQTERQGHDAVFGRDLFGDDDGVGEGEFFHERFSTEFRVCRRNATIDVAPV